MKVRGSVTKSIEEFVKINHPNDFDKWFSKLTPESKEILAGAGSTKWYPVNEGVLIPTQIMCNLFYEDAKKGAWESGRYSAKSALTGVYKVFVLISTPTFLLKRATRIISTFYDPSELEVANTTNKSMVILYKTLPANSELIECRIAGWMEQALEMCGCKNLSVTTPRSLAKGDDVFEVKIKWD